MSEFEIVHASDPRALDALLVLEEGAEQDAARNGGHRHGTTDSEVAALCSFTQTDALLALISLREDHITEHVGFKNPDGSFEKGWRVIDSARAEAYLAYARDQDAPASFCWAAFQPQHRGRPSSLACV